MKYSKFLRQHSLLSSRNHSFIIKSSISIITLGTWLELLKDKIAYEKEVIEEHLSNDLYNFLALWILINQLIKVIVAYLDLTTGTYIKDFSNF